MFYLTFYIRKYILKNKTNATDADVITIAIKYTLLFIDLEDTLIPIDRKKTTDNYLEHFKSSKKEILNKVREVFMQNNENIEQPNDNTTMSVNINLSHSVFYLANVMFKRSEEEDTSKSITWSEILNFALYFFIAGNGELKNWKLNNKPLLKLHGNKSKNIMQNSFKAVINNHLNDFTEIYDIFCGTLSLDMCIDTSLFTGKFHVNDWEKNDNNINDDCKINLYEMILKEPLKLKAIMYYLSYNYSKNDRDDNKKAFKKIKNEYENYKPQGKNSNITDYDKLIKAALSYHVFMHIKSCKLGIP